MYFKMFNIKHFFKIFFFSFQDVSNICVPMTASNTQDRMDSSGQWMSKSVFLFKICKLFSQANLMYKYLTKNQHICHFPWRTV